MSSPNYLVPQSSPPFQSAQPREVASEVNDGEISSGNSPQSPERPAHGGHKEETDDDDLYEPSKRSTKRPKRRPTRSKERQSLQSDRFLSQNTPPTSRQSKRHSGPKSTWRSWTAADRAIATSLDQLTSQDLSLHLYNAHAFKQRARLARQDPDRRNYDARLWEPPRLWTAWPLASEDVPRERDGAWEDGINEGGRKRRKQDPRKAGEDIEDILVGVVLKTARERLREEYPPGDRAEASSSSSNSSSSSSSELESDSQSTSSSSSPFPSPSNTFNTTQPPNPLNPTRMFNPTPLTDDALATSILLPTIRHTLSNLDILLTGLHYARQASLRVNDDSASETQTDLEQSDSSEDDSAPISKSKSKRKRKSASGTRSKQPRSKSRSKGKRKGKAKSKAKDSNSDSGSDSGSDSADSEPKAARPSPSPHSRTRILARRQMRLGLRDWSDVLGIAALQGWDSAVIDAAARRCASLFGEGMDFRVLRAEGGDGKDGEGANGDGEVVRYRPGGGSGR
ncbi:hypothetical protein MMC30_002425 [Trapelia coarctata]|nr:hypothetical protein [Trapelia coarctata]